MSDTKEKWLNMTTAFFVSQEYTAKENVRDFRKWLEEEGYTEVKSEYANLFGAFYIDIATKTYAQASADVLLAPIVGFQGLEYNDFKAIHNIFKHRADKEKTWRYRPAYLTPLAVYLWHKDFARKEKEEEKREYFSKNPSFKEWCEDIYQAIKDDHWYKKHWPDYSKEDFQDCVDYVLIRRELEYYYKKQTMPAEIAGNWGLITM